MSTNYISILDCVKKDPSLETFIALCNALETSADEILWDHLTERHRIQATQLAEYIGNMPKEKQEELFRVVDVIVDLP